MRLYTRPYVQHARMHAKIAQIILDEKSPQRSPPKRHPGLRSLYSTGLLMVPWYYLEIDRGCPPGKKILRRYHPAARIAFISAMSTTIS